MEEGSSDREVDQCTAPGTDASTGTARSRRMISHPARKKFKPHALASCVNTSPTSCGGADFLTSRVLASRSRPSASASPLSIRDISNKLCDTDAGRPQRRHANHETAPHRSVLISELGRQRNLVRQALPAVDVPCRFTHWLWIDREERGALRTARRRPRCLFAHSSWPAPPDSKRIGEPKLPISDGRADLPRYPSRASST